MKAIAALVLALLSFTAAAQELIYEKGDSARIEEILKESIQKRYATQGERIIEIAGNFVGETYVASTLENGEEEPLFISCSKLDCTTFVELVLAIAITAQEGKEDFASVCSNIERIRYRNGVRNGYASRLHYISWWIDDNAKEGMLKEVTSLSPTESGRMELNYMSTHADRYPLLRNNSKAITEIAEMEQPYRGISKKYIPKNILDKGKEVLDIIDGDIIALVTTIEGLDVTHVGFAYWENGQLHLLHASSQEKRIVKENRTLHEYQKNRRSQTGIRVFRAL